MIQVESIQWVRDAWEVRCCIDEGIYHLKGYPVRLTHLAYTENADVRTAMTTVARALLERHMRYGAVPPHAMVMDWSRAERVCQGGSEEMTTACRMVSGASLFEVGSGISNHF